MEKKLLVGLIDEIFIPLGFKKKGFSWSSKSPDIIKIIDLERSNQSNLFNISYGFVIRDLELDSPFHVGNQLRGNDRNEQLIINELLNLDSSVKTPERLEKLKKLLNQQVVKQFNSINSVDNLYNDLNNRTHLNNIPQIVKEYFNF